MKLTRKLKMNLNLQNLQVNQIKQADKFKSFKKSSKVMEFTITNEVTVISHFGFVRITQPVISHRISNSRKKIRVYHIKKNQTYHIKKNHLFNKISKNIKELISIIFVYNTQINFMYRPNISHV